MDDEQREQASRAGRIALAFIVVCVVIALLVLLDLNREIRRARREVNRGRAGLSEPRPQPGRGGPRPDLLWAMWTLMVPEPTRRELKLRTILWSARVTNRLGRRAAEGSLAREATTGQASYELPYALMAASEKLTAAYQRMTL
jgi:hypothetical protein